MLDLREKLEGCPLVGDGAMGTLLVERGVDHPHDKTSLVHPPAIRDLHEEYLRAGAKVIETNAFSANRMKLALRDLGEKVWEINIAGAHLARKAVDVLPLGKGALVLGSIRLLERPLAPIGSILPD